MDEEVAGRDRGVRAPDDPAFVELVRVLDALERLELERLRRIHAERRVKAAQFTGSHAAIAATLQVQVDALAEELGHVDGHEEIRGPRGSRQQRRAAASRARKQARALAKQVDARRKLADLVAPFDFAGSTVEVSDPDEDFADELTDATGIGGQS